MTESAEAIVERLQRDVARLQSENASLKRTPLAHWLVSIVRAAHRNVARHPAHAPPLTPHLRSRAGHAAASG
jgi:hypothetical protein